MSKRKALARIQQNQRITAAMANSSARHHVVHPGVDIGSLRLGYINMLPLEGCVTRLQEAFGIEADGWPGNGFLCALWNDNKPPIDVVRSRVISAMQMGDVDYVLGAGANDWFAKECDEGNGCDCSAFVAWSLGRKKGGGPDWKNSKGQNNWLHTGSIVHDATNDQVMFKQVEMQPWSIFSYADKGGKQGHTGWVTGVEDGSPIIIDCSSSQSRKLGDAVRMRPGDYLLNRDDVIYCVPSWWPHEGNVA